MLMLNGIVGRTKHEPFKFLLFYFFVHAWITYVGLAEPHSAGLHMGAQHVHNQFGKGSDLHEGATFTPQRCRSEPCPNWT